MDDAQCRCLYQEVPLLQLSKPIYAPDQNDCDEAPVSVYRTWLASLLLGYVRMRLGLCKDWADMVCTAYTNDEYSMNTRSLLATIVRERITG
jgi:hypothetical protein